MNKYSSFRWRINNETLVANLPVTKFKMTFAFLSISSDALYSQFSSENMRDVVQSGFEIEDMKVIRQ